VGSISITRSSLRGLTFAAGGSLCKQPGRQGRANRARLKPPRLDGSALATGKLAAPCYHPPLCSAGAPASNDAAPQADVVGLDLARIKPEYCAIDASLNGPNTLMIDNTDSNTWVMKGSELGLDPQQTHAQFMMSRK
jgi:hypothetical protein